MSTFKSRPNAYALLIGINDYAAYDASAGLAAKTSDLHGAEHDVRQYWRMARALGIPAANIRVACAPADGRVLDASALPGDSDAAYVTGASLPEIEAGLTWLASKLDTSGVSAGILSVSAHGSYDAERGSLICASDTQLHGETLTGTLSMSALHGHLASRPKHTPVTIFVDACDAGGGATAQGDRGRALRAGSADGRKKVEPIRRPDDLVLAASAPGAESYEISVDDTVRGAFSWAALAVLERWGIHHTPADAHVDITYGELPGRIDALLSALKVDQAAHFDANDVQAARKVFAKRLDIEPGAPDQPHFTGGREISPGSNGYVRMYKVNRLVGSNSAQKAILWVPGPGSTSWLQGQMYWEATGWPDFYAALQSLESKGSIQIEFVADIKFNYLAPSPPGSAVKYTTSNAWQLDSLPTETQSTKYGQFSYAGKTCFIRDDQSGDLTWLLDKNVTLPSTGYLIDGGSGSAVLEILKPMTSPNSAEDYLQVDDA